MATERASGLSEASVIGEVYNEIRTKRSTPMKTPLFRHWKTAILWALSLLTVGAISALAQGQRRDQGLMRPTQIPTVLSGGDLGFRVERTEDGLLVGRLVVRVGGRWVDTTIP